MTKAVFHYKLYGLHLQSNRALFGLQETDSPQKTDLCVRCHEHAPGFWIDELPWKPIDKALSNPTRQIRSVWTAQTTSGIYRCIHFQSPVDDEFIRFTIDPLFETIWAIWTPRCNSIKDATNLLLGPVIGALLRLRGILCFHASVVGGIKGGAIALAGMKGAGKSTTAAAMTRQTGQIISDDIAVISENPIYQIAPAGISAPIVRLSDDAAAHRKDGLYEIAAPWTRLLPAKDKRYFKASESALRNQFWPLKAIYVLKPLGQRAAPCVCRMPAAQALINLLRHTYAGWILNVEQRAWEFSQLGKLAAKTPIFWIKRPHDLDQLPRLAETLIRHASAECGK